MRFVDIIEKKRDAKKLTKEEIDFFVTSYVNGSAPDYQAAALLMAVFLNGMDLEETTHLTLATMRSGDVIKLDRIKGHIVDKHSTGGVGDKTSIALGPMIAACGVPVAKLSGRGLGHTGGTLDKLESFSGFSFELSEQEFIDSVNKIGIAIAGQTANLVPADKKLYALRDVTATVSNTALIAASIMGKKLASGADAIVLDVKCGDGGFMKNLEDARNLARTMAGIGNNVGKKTVAVSSNMDQPLGNAIGNALEVIEAIETLTGAGSPELLELCLALGSHMIVLGGKAENADEGKEKLQEVIANGKALEKLKEFISNQGGDISPIDDYSRFPQAEYTEDILSGSHGVVDSLKAADVGTASMLLGAGRETKESEIDLAAGIILHKKTGDKVTKGEPLATIYYNRLETGKKNEAVDKLVNAYTIGGESKVRGDLILDVIE